MDLGWWWLWCIDLLELHPACSGIPGNTNIIMQTGFFWMNGKQLRICTLSLFSFIRELPEPIPLEMVRWSSVTSSLASSSTQWSDVLVAELFRLISALYEQHEVILAELGFLKERPLKQRDAMHLFERHMDGLWEIVSIAGCAPLSAWATSEDDLHDAKTQFALNDEPFFSSVIDLPHIRSSINEAHREHLELKSRALRFQAQYNRRKKCIRRGN